MNFVTNVYPNASVSGPNRNSETGRLHVCVWLKDKKISINLTLARFRMQEHLGRILDPEEEVDHIDEDKTNDELSNLQILTKAENLKKAHTKYIDPTKANCFFCEREFTLTPKQQSQRHMNRRRTSGPFCSHSCAGKFGNSQRK